jgi:hypothetical protein
MYTLYRNATAQQGNLMVFNMETTKFPCRLLYYYTTVLRIVVGTPAFSEFRFPHWFQSPCWVGHDDGEVSLNAIADGKMSED